MKLELPEIYWHGNRERIMSLDFNKNFELVTAGADLTGGVYLRLWEVSLSPVFKVMHLEDLAGTHERSVNVVRFSPCNRFIASGSDDTCIVVWEKKYKPVFGQDKYEIGWGSKRVLRGHLREIHDLCWNDKADCIASGSLDGQVIIFDVEKAKIVQRLEGNKPVHGVAWSNSYLASMSTDRCLRLYEEGKKGFYIKHCIKEHDSIKLFQDQTSSSAYFRRLAFSPESNFLLASSGIAKGVPCVHCFGEDFSCPKVSYPVHLTPYASALSVKFCPVVFVSKGSAVYKNIKNKLVWAVACKDSVILYNSDEIQPVGAIINPHYSSITDITWYKDQALAISSIDGYVSFIIFSSQELGEKLYEIESSRAEMDVDIQKPLSEAMETLCSKKGQWKAT